jgi:hypothetical protein
VVYPPGGSSAPFNLHVSPHLGERRQPPAADALTVDVGAALDERADRRRAGGPDDIIIPAIDCRFLFVELLGGVVLA